MQRANTQPFASGSRDLNRSEIVSGTRVLQLGCSGERGKTSFAPQTTADWEVLRLSGPSVLGIPKMAPRWDAG